MNKSYTTNIIYTCTGETALHNSGKLAISSGSPTRSDNSDCDKNCPFSKASI
jgi:hypothetical protein